MSTAAEQPEVRTLLKREESYAIHALVNIHENPGTNAAVIAKHLQIPPAFLAKVLRKLVNAGFIQSRMGRNGGVDLLVDLADITMLDVIEAVSGRMITDSCQTRELCATQQRKGRCNVKPAWFKLTGAIRSAFAEIRMSDLIDKTHEPGPSAVELPAA
ncbi:MAG TPA: Rrf2 family transcriptional regulator [Deinococcales bacterium]|nr:Rrf2 family transcriptional regulator [Deinococcales bacterium]